MIYNIDVIQVYSTYSKIHFFLSLIFSNIYIIFCQYKYPAFDYNKIIMGCNRCGVSNQIYTCSQCGNQACLSCGTDVYGRKLRAANVCSNCNATNSWRK